MNRITTLLAAAAVSTAAMADNSLTNPLTAPYEESFSGCQYQSEPWTVTVLEGEAPTVELVNHDEATGMYAFSNRDKGFLRVKNDKAGKVMLMSPYIKVVDNADDTWMIGLAYFRNSNFEMAAKVEWDGGEPENDYYIGIWPSDDMNPVWITTSGNGWPAYGDQHGKVMRFGWEITADGTGGVMIIDDVYFAKKESYEFGLVYSRTTPVAKAGQTINASTNVACNGRLTSQKFHVVLALDGTEIATGASPADNGPWGTNYTPYSFDYQLPTDIAAGEHEIKFTLFFEGDYANDDQPGDSNPDNDVATVKFNVVNDYLPGVANLVNNGGTLSWTTPAKGERFTDNIESLESYTDGNLDVLYELHPLYDYDMLYKAYGNSGEIGLYSVIDGDQKVTVTDDAWVEALVPNIFHLMACTVADFTTPVEGMEAASGNKALLFWSNEDGSPCDNYLVLPELNPEDLKVTFKARAYDTDAPEKIELMTSSSGTGAGDFTAVKTVDVTTADYTDVEFDVPAGTKYVAIHHISDEGWGLLVDDLSYAIKARDFQGYNVYFNGTKANSELLKEPLFEAEQPGTYGVTVVYAEGESTPVEIKVEDSAINSINAEATDADTVYYNLQGIRVENPGTGVYIKVSGSKSTKIIL